ncbi:unnamed protein product [Rotaria sordida]|uniref:FMN hydroxy acid dehydrogenase domain-containing protein n=1 Tax=Rotaria sordida TaxID=392033 RepID=A0A815RP22_9BILA|nr:unnamed protein product [Rotaria sordida]
MMSHRFYYYDYKAGQGHTYQACRHYFDKQLRIMPRVLMDVSEISLKTTIFGSIYESPILIATSACHCLAHVDGEVATARAATETQCIFTYNWTFSNIPEEYVLQTLGILSSIDAELAIKYGANGIIVRSTFNHGDRLIDTAPPAIECLEDVVNAVDGRAEVFVDTGIRSGTDVLKAFALGARAVLIGRPVLYGLACGGRDGVRRVLDILKRELVYDMACCGLTSIDQINKDILYKH